MISITQRENVKLTAGFTERPAQKNPGCLSFLKKKTISTPMSTFLTFKRKTAEGESGIEEGTCTVTPLRSWSSRSNV
jgi:hypothetical protein